MEQIPSWKAKRFTASQEIPRNSEGSLPHTQEPTACLYPKSDQALPQHFL